MESPKVWNYTFNESASQNNFKRSMYDCCLYFNDKIWIIIYVDDILLLGKDIEKTMKLLKTHFPAKDLSEVKNFLGMNITRTKEMMKIK